MGRRSFGLVRRLPSGRWQASYHHPRLGKRVNGATTFRTKADANLWLAREETIVRTGGTSVDPRRGKVRFDTYASTWLEDRPLRPRTREVYASILRVDVLPELGPLPLNGITTDRVRRWHRQLAKTKPAMAPKAYRLLRTVLTTAVDDAILSENPCRLRGASSEKAGERRIPSLAEVERLAACIERRYRAAVFLAAYCGLRRGECFGLARRHVVVDGERAMVRVERTRAEVSGLGLVFQEPKTDAGARVVVLPDRVWAELKAHLAEFVPENAEALLFAAARSGDVPRASSWTRIWDHARTAAGVPEIRFHDLRHLAGTLTALAGGTIKEIQARLGHASPDAAMLYQHVAQGRDGVLAAEIDRIIRGEVAKAG
jgi:integrase